MSSKEEVELHLKEAHGKKEEEERNAPEDLLEYEEPNIEFDNSVPTWQEFSSKLRKARNKSAPGPNGVPYLVYKRCPGVAYLLNGY